MNIRKLRTVGILILAPFVSLAQNPLTITGKFPAHMDGKKISMMYNGSRSFQLDSARIMNGQVSFNLEQAKPQVVTISTGDKAPMDMIRVYVAKENLTISTKDSLKNAVVNGDPLSEDYQRMYGPVDRIMSKRFAIVSELGKLSPEEKAGTTGAELKSRMEKIYKQERLLTFKAIDQNPSSYIALKLLGDMAGGTISYDEMMPHFKNLSAELKASKEGKALEEKILLVKNLRSGMEANDFESFTPEGEKLRLSTIYPKSKYTFIDFWASWCMPCRAENPNVVKAYENYGKKGLTILSISLDTKAEPWKAAIEKDGMPWLHVSQLKGFDEPAAVLYGIKMIPQNVLVDSKGKIVASNLRGAALEDKLKELMH